MMQTTKGILQVGNFYIDHIKSEDSDDIAAFRVNKEEGQGLSNL